MTRILVLGGLVMMGLLLTAVALTSMTAKQHDQTKAATAIYTTDVGADLLATAISTTPQQAIDTSPGQAYAMATTIDASSIMTATKSISGEYAMTTTDAMKTTAQIGITTGTRAGLTFTRAVTTTTPSWQVASTTKKHACTMMSPDDTMGSSAAMMKVQPATILAAGLASSMQISAVALT